MTEETGNAYTETDETASAIPATEMTEKRKTIDLITSLPQFKLVTRSDGWSSFNGRVSTLNRSSYIRQGKKEIARPEQPSKELKRPRIVFMMSDANCLLRCLRAIVSTAEATKIFKSTPSIRAAVLRQAAEALAYAAIIRRNWRPLRKCAGAVGEAAATATQTLFDFFQYKIDHHVSLLFNLERRQLLPQKSVLSPCRHKPPSSPRTPRPTPPVTLTPTSPSSVNLAPHTPVADRISGDSLLTATQRKHVPIAQLEHHQQHIPI
ncbi:hypothetical protein CBL_03182 [Carabus blaptoides fortunei]